MRDGTLLLETPFRLKQLELRNRLLLGGDEVQDDGTFPLFFIVVLLP